MHNSRGLAQHVIRRPMEYYQCYSRLQLRKGYSPLGFQKNKSKSNNQQQLNDLILK